MPVLEEELRRLFARMPNCDLLGLGQIQHRIIPAESGHKPKQYLRTRPDGLLEQSRMDSIYEH